MARRTPSAIKKLLPAALAVRQRAHAPYSGFAVGAAVLGDDGRVYAGCNVENSSYGATLCAERNAVAAAVARGAKRILGVAVVTPSPEPGPPCGICLQVLSEFGDPDMPVLLATSGGKEEELRFGDLLPRAFDASYLARSKAGKRVASSR